MNVYLFLKRRLIFDYMDFFILDEGFFFYFLQSWTNTNWNQMECAFLFNQTKSNMDHNSVLNKLTNLLSYVFETLYHQEVMFV